LFEPAPGGFELTCEQLAITIDDTLGRIQPLANGTHWGKRTRFGSCAQHAARLFMKVRLATEMRIEAAARQSAFTHYGLDPGGLESLRCKQPCSGL
jgi:hypothetical protein